METILNKKQREVVEEIESNILLLASAGTGKTNTLAHRISNIIENNKAKSEEILCITFTNKASKEMKERIESIVNKDGENVIVKTFHSFCFDILKEEAKKNTDIYTDFIICDEEDCKEVIKTVNYYKFSLASLQNFIALVKEYKGIYDIYTEDSLKDYEKIIKRLYKEQSEKIKNICIGEEYSLDYNMMNILEKEGAKIVQSYNSALYNNHNLDFNDLIIKVHELFKDFKIIEGIRNKFKYISIDEVQDTSYLEYEIIEKLFYKNNILLCGDPFQTIYQWRGSIPNIIIKEFTEKYNPIKIVFNENYRSTKRLIEASFRYLKNVFSLEVEATYNNEIEAISNLNGEKICLKELNSIKDEANFIFSEIKNLKLTDVSKVCILTRNNKYNIDLSNELANINRSLDACDKLNFILIDEFRFFRRQEIKDVLAVLKLCTNKYDSNSLKRIIKRFKTGISLSAINTITSKDYKEVGINISDFIDNKTHVYGDKYGLLMKEINNDNVIVFDVESTGVNTTEDEIIQIAAIKINSKGEVIDSFEKLLKNNKSVRTSEKVHGFSDEYLKRHGEDKIDGLKEFLKFSKRAVVVGHNVQYDINILTSELKRNGLENPNFLDFYDTLDIYRRFYPNLPKHKLNTLSELFNINNKPTHDAMDDILATAELLLLAIKNKIKPLAFERQMLVGKHLESFTKLSLKLNNIIRLSELERPKNIIAKIIEEFEIKKLYEKEMQRVYRLREFYLIAKDLDNLNLSPQDAMIEFLKITSLSNGDMERILKGQARIPIITVHQAKGLEFDYVFLAGIQENVFPSYQAIKSSNLKEEERVFYVAITRAKKKLYLTYAKNSKGRRNNISRFIKNIPNEFIEK
ncbi:UvrD-helicase domain-containing protein [Clostridium chauvoei]|uniref:3'-5' exonuclease n=1 Tax=Clostridium chauvoei TaxID=46867 RepID=UPI001C842B31|nr:3'-5' exonuclease [Clostridium chauvoei]MBX7394824.1 UvrD-helicase domain-containing protein [Clostridium chauvoei]